MSYNTATTEQPLEKENVVPRQKVDELVEHTAHDGQVAQSRASTTTIRQRSILLYGLTLAASLAPSYLVMKDRWMKDRVEIEATNRLWWDSTTVDSLAYPQYFLLVFFFLFLATLTIFVWPKHRAMIFSHLNLKSLEDISLTAKGIKLTGANYVLFTGIILVDLSALWMILQGRIPSWDLLMALTLVITGLILLERKSTSWRELIRVRGKYYLDAVLLVVALFCALYAAFGEAKPNLIFYILLLAAALNFLRHRTRTPLLFWISILSLVALTWNLNDWHYAAIGDEYNFYMAIREVLDNRSPRELVDTTFNGSLVYGSHPYLSSYIQNLFMKLFDNHNFGWRLSNPALVAASLPFFYYFLRAFVRLRIALTAIICMGFSHYLISFSKIGYNNLQAFFAMGVVLACFTWALKSKRILAFCMTGLSMGLCFYLYPAALYVLPVPIIGFLLFMPPTRQEALRGWGWMILSASFLIYPLIIQSDYWIAKIAGTFLYTDVIASPSALGDNILRNILYSAFSYLYIPKESHFVSIGYLDLLSSAFVPAGFIYLAKDTFQRNRPALFLMLSFVTMFFVVGTTHGREFPTTTRMFMLLPWFALFTALGLTWALDQARDLFRIRPNRLGYLFVGLFIVLNLYQAYVIDVRNMAQYHTLGPMFIKTVREINDKPDLPSKSYAFVTTPDWGAEGIRMLQRVYLVPDSPRQIINVPVDGNQLPDGAQELVRQRDIIVIVRANVEPGLITQVDAQLQGWGKQMCEIRNGEGTLQFQLWHSGDLDWLCHS